MLKISRRCASLTFLVSFSTTIWIWRVVGEKLSERRCRRRWKVPLSFSKVDLRCSFDSCCGLGSGDDDLPFRGSCFAREFDWAVRGRTHELRLHYALENHALILTATGSERLSEV